MSNVKLLTNDKSILTLKHPKLTVLDARKLTYSEINKIIFSNYDKLYIVTRIDLQI